MSVESKNNKSKKQTEPKIIIKDKNKKYDLNSLSTKETKNNNKFNNLQISSKINDFNIMGVYDTPYRQSFIDIIENRKKNMKNNNKEIITEILYPPFLPFPYNSLNNQQTFPDFEQQYYDNNENKDNKYFIKKNKINDSKLHKKNYARDTYNREIKTKDDNNEDEDSENDENNNYPIPKKNINESDNNEEKEEKEDNDEIDNDDYNEEEEEEEEEEDEK